MNSRKVAGGDIYSLTAEYLVPNIGTAVWLLSIISQVYADAIYRDTFCHLGYNDNWCDLMLG